MADRQKGGLLATALLASLVTACQRPNAVDHDEHKAEFAMASYHVCMINQAEALVANRRDLAGPEIGGIIADAEQACADDFEKSRRHLIGLNGEGAGERLASNFKRAIRSDTRKAIHELTARNAKASM
ncbi:hypothetical protein JL101_027460 [Skermanella rosea]|uniref:Lipoprotein n=1 Tax=Skermanella cutis TaxID=2775420 RepID=A0ABX7B5A1_9PROT|nr:MULTISPECIES: hypothetical protein [Skermanella]QQP89501.1 hypothetical protein IGS68_26610 [Skermanella sp. TT6]UEM03645.1 hypothetical protein JL101_027460 [Skermanella rosea]